MPLARKNDACPECCKRRIVCDKTVPRCLKCTKKGIRCSGPGLRCNLSTYMISPGPRTATPPPQLSIALPEEASSPKISRKRDNERQPPALHRIRWLSIGQVSRRDHKARIRRTPITPSDGDSYDEAPNPTATTEISLALMKPDFSSPLLSTLSSSLDPRVRMLFNHFSESVAPIMVVLDSVRNGYRDIILPLACQDEVLGRAVSVISAFHLAQKSQDMRKIAEMGYQAIIRRLQRDSMSLQPGHIFNHYTLATILVLLVGETITGVDNYVRLLDMLDCFTQSPESISALPKELQSFFSEQIRMFQFFGLPLSDETKGLQIVCNSPQQYWDFMEYPNLSTGSELDRNMRIIKEAMIDACGIYRRRVESNLQPEESSQIIDQLQKKVLPLDAFTEGGHALVWTYFIAAAESTLPHHRQFFSTRLKELYSHTGFGSIPASLQSLEKIWDLEETRRWTQVITSDVFVLVM